MSDSTVVLLNLALPAALLLVVLVTLFVARNSQKKPTVWITGFAVAAVIGIVYATLQPSYLPKSTVPAMSRVPLEHKPQAEIQDRLLKPMAEEERNRHFEQTFDAMDRVRAINSQPNSQDNSP